MAVTGRPTKLTDTTLIEAREYLDSLNASTDTELPTIEGLALHLHISRETVYEWEKETPDFSDIVKELRSKQAQKLIQNALSNKYNASIAKLILSGKHGYVEKTSLDAKVETVTPILGAKSKDVHTDDGDQETTEA